MVSAGTRNRFALDLGLDRSDPSRCLDALTDGEELRVDLGDVAGRAFVNTVSFGVYADVVQRPEYRDDKAGTALTSCRTCCSANTCAGSTHASTARSSRPSRRCWSATTRTPDELGGGGRRPRLDGGELGVLSIRVEDAAQATNLAVRGSQSAGPTVPTAQRVNVTVDMDEMPVAVDGEALRMPTLVVCTLRPGALRVLLPRDRPGVVAPAPPVNWRRIIDLAFGRTGRTTAERTRS